MAKTSHLDKARMGPAGRPSPHSRLANQLESASPQPQHVAPLVPFTPETPFHNANKDGQHLLSVGKTGHFPHSIFSSQLLFPFINTPYLTSIAAKNFQVIMARFPAIKACLLSYGLYQWVRMPTFHLIVIIYYI